MTRIIVCGTLLSLVIWGIRSAMKAVFNYDYWMGIEVGLAAMAVITALAFAWDHFERKRSQKLLRSAPPDRPQQAPQQRLIADAQEHQR
jgi:hypothetical protein